MNKKGVITTIIGSLGFLCFAALLISFLTDAISIEEFGVASSTVTAFFLFLLSVYSKDKNASHTKDVKFGDIPNPKKQQK